LKYWQALKELKEVLNAISKRVALKPSKFYNFEHPRLLGILNPKVGIHVESCIFSFWVWVVLSLPLPSLTSFQPTSFTHSSFICKPTVKVIPSFIHIFNFINMIQLHPSCISSYDPYDKFHSYGLILFHDVTKFSHLSWHPTTTYIWNISMSPFFIHAESFHLCLQSFIMNGINMPSYVYIYLYNTSGYPWPSDIVKSPRSEWGGVRGSKKRQYYQIYLVGFECVVKDIEAWL
jgi:hypothetical protein